VAPVDELVKVAVYGAVQLYVEAAEKEATGPEITVTVCVTVSKHEPACTTRRTVYVPVAVYVWVGLAAVLAVPSPNSHELV